MPFAIIFPVLKLKNLKEIIHEAYSDPGSCPAPRRILAYGVLGKIFTDFRAFPLHGQNIDRFGAYGIMCQRHMEVAMGQLDIFMPATYENIMALLISAMCLIEMCKPSTCWIMISAAAGLSQNLGYHRINTMTNDSVEDRDAKIRVFWTIYMFDKTLSLRLGRASIIQDWDISLPFISVKEKPMSSLSGSQILSYWVKVARVQGLTYEKLFSPAAFLQPVEERARIAQELVNTMNQAWYERPQAVFMKFTSDGEEILFMPQQTTPTIHSPDTTEIPSKRKGLEPPKLITGSLNASEYLAG